MATTGTTRPFEQLLTRRDDQARPRPKVGAWVRSSESSESSSKVCQLEKRQLEERRFASELSAQGWELLQSCKLASFTLQTNKLAKLRVRHRVQRAYELPAWDQDMLLVGFTVARAGKRINGNAVSQARPRVR